jgi:aspartate/methionine/tyrosine aminotransferase
MPSPTFLSYALLFSLLGAKAIKMYCDIFHLQDKNYDPSFQQQQIFIKKLPDTLH